MKPLEFVLPAAALLVAGMWLGSQNRSIYALVEGNAQIRKQLETVRVPQSGNASGPRAGREMSAPKQRGGRIAWKQIVLEQISARGSGGASEMRASIELQQLLSGLSKDEISAALDEIEGLDLPQGEKQRFEFIVVGMIAGNHPDLVMERFGDRYEENGMSWQLPFALASWAEKDLAAAAEWMDMQIAGGKFESKTLDGKNENRLSFESKLVEALLKSDPAAAVARMEELPENDRAGVFSPRMPFNVKAGTEKALADLIRATVPEEQRISALTNSVRLLVQQGGYERTGDFLGKIGASNEEREAIVSQAFNDKLNSSPATGEEWALEFEKGREWMGEEVPEASNRMTGEALGRLDRDYEEISLLARKYHEESGDDEVLVAFLEGNASKRNTEAALLLADRISDETKREEIRARIEGAKHSGKIPR